MRRIFKPQNKFGSNSQLLVNKSRTVYDPRPMADQDNKFYNSEGLTCQRKIG